MWLAMHNKGECPICPPPTSTCEGGGLLKGKSDRGASSILGFSILGLISSWIFLRFFRKIKYVLKVHANAGFFLYKHNYC